MKRADGTHVRYFSTSAEVIAYLKEHPGEVFLLEAAGSPLTYLEKESGEYGPTHGDVFVGQVKYDDAIGQVVCT